MYALSSGLEHDNQKNQNNNENHYSGDLLVIIRLPRYSPDPLPRAVQPTLMSVHMLVYVVKHRDMLVQLIPNLDA